MNDKQAEYVLTVLKEGSFTAAAKRLYISQPSLSQMVKAAENRLGAPIFDRTTDPITLTPAGKLYVEAALQVRGITENLEKQVKELAEEERGALHIGISIQRAIELVPYLYPAFSKEFPYVKLEFHEQGSADLEKSILENTIDFACLATVPLNSKLTYELIKEEYAVLLVNRDCELAGKYPAGTPVDIREARGETFISCKKGHGIRKTQDMMFLAYGISPEIAFEIDSIEVGKRTVAASRTVMMCPDTFADLVGTYPYRVYPLKHVDVSRHFYVCYRKGMYMNRYQKGFLRILHEMPKAAEPTAAFQMIREDKMRN